MKLNRYEKRYVRVTTDRDDGSILPSQHFILFEGISRFEAFRMISKIIKSYDDIMVSCVDDFTYTPVYKTMELDSDKMYFGKFTVRAQIDAAKMDVFDFFDVLDTICSEYKKLSGENSQMAFQTRLPYCLNDLEFFLWNDDTELTYIKYLERCEGHCKQTFPMSYEVIRDTQEAFQKERERLIESDPDDKD